MIRPTDDGLEFMGKDWDKLEGDVPPGYTEKPRWHDVGWQGFKSLPNFFIAGPKAQAFHRSWLEQCFRILTSGGIIKTFGGPRTFHRVAVAMIDVGFEIVDLEAWGYGSGFPKSLNVGRAIDRSGGIVPIHIEARHNMALDIRRKREQAGLTRRDLARMFPYGYVTENWERLDDGFRVPSPEDYERLVKDLGVDPQWRAQVRAEDLRHKEFGVKKDRRGDGTVYALAHRGVKYEPTTVEAKKWEGWGTGLKPAWEPVVVGRKP